MKTETEKGVQLTEGDARFVKGMLARGDRQHDIAAWFGVNPARIAEIKKGKTFARVKKRLIDLPPRGPYVHSAMANIRVKVMRRQLTGAYNAMKMSRDYLDRNMDSLVNVLSEFDLDDRKKGRK